MYACLVFPRNESVSTNSARQSLPVPRGLK